MMNSNRHQQDTRTDIADRRCIMVPSRPMTYDNFMPDGVDESNPEGPQRELIECSRSWVGSNNEGEEDEGAAWCIQAEAASSVSSFMAASRLAHEILASAVQALGDDDGEASSDRRTFLLLSLVSLSLPDGVGQGHLSATCAAASSEALNGGVGADEGACCDVAEPHPSAARSYRQVIKSTSFVKPDFIFWRRGEAGGGV